MTYTHLPKKKSPINILLIPILFNFIQQIGSIKYKYNTEFYSETMIQLRNWIKEVENKNSWVEKREEGDTQKEDLGIGEELLH